MILEAKGLGKRFGREWVLESVDWHLQPARLSAVIGLNGAGKTTLLNLLAGLYVGSRGEVLADGEPLRRGSVAARRAIFFLPDFPVLSASWTLYRHLAALAVMYERPTGPIRERFEALVREMDLEKVVDKPFAQMSRGQLYKASLICMRLIDAEYWLLDEPFASGIDSHGTSVMKRWFREACERGRCVVFTTQLPEIAVLADEVALLHRRQIRFHRTRDRDVLDEEGKPFDLESRMEELRCGS